MAVLFEEGKEVQQDRVNCLRSQSLFKTEPGLQPPVSDRPMPRECHDG